ncbi:hypothetical protein C5D07_08545 [Rathayibacter tritici]|nr:hypothetical protein C5C06_02040 [Rathayibacter tritici]PPI14106.1 hypothetical protein C5D07_08545 [Rathayibacter tritici]
MPQSARRIDCLANPGDMIVTRGTDSHAHEFALDRLNQVPGTRDHWSLIGHESGQQVLRTVDEIFDFSHQPGHRADELGEPFSKVTVREGSLTDETCSEEPVHQTR